MSTGLGSIAEAMGRVLIVDDDHRVVELLNVALSGRGYEVLTASDGEEAIRQTLAHRPDLIVLDVRLPRRSGFEVCELLRRDIDLSGVPIVMVSAAGEPEARLQAFAKGADDYLTKPFSPRELLARIQRLLVRARDAREARQRARELERELHRTQDEARRAQQEILREQRLRELAFGLGAEIHRTLDPDEAAARLLEAVRKRFGFGRVALLLADEQGGRLAPHAVLGDAFQGIAGLSLDPNGELGTLLNGLGRPVPRRALERFPELAAEMPPLVAAGVLLLSPLVAADGALLGVLLADRRAEGAELERGEGELLAGLCQLAALALSNGCRVQRTIEATLELLARSAPEAPAPEWCAEARDLAETAARAGGLPPRARRVIRHAIGLGRWGLSAHGFRALETIATDDPTGIVAEVRRTLDRLERMPEPYAAGNPPFERAATLAFVGLRYAEERQAGLEPEPALDRAAAAASELLDPESERVLRARVRSLREARASEHFAA